MRLRRVFKDSDSDAIESRGFGSIRDLVSLMRLPKYLDQRSSISDVFALKNSTTGTACSDVIA